MALRSLPTQIELIGQNAQSDLSGLHRLESMIADLADRLDDATRTQTGTSTDQHFFESLTGRLDSLAAQFAQSQSRFDAVDRIGRDIEQLASTPPKAPMNEAKLAEAAAIKALQQVGPIVSGPTDKGLDVIIDGLKDDLSGLRRLAETSDTSTKESLTSVSGMLNGIANRLATLEEEVRAKEASPDPTYAPASDPRGTPETAYAEDVEVSTSGLRKLLRRSKKNRQTDTPAASASQTSAPSGNESQTHQRSAAELLANRGNHSPRRGSGSASSAQTGGGMTEAQGTSGGDRQPRIAISGRAISASAQPRGSQHSQKTHSQGPTPSRLATEGNAALQMQPEQPAEPQRRMAQIVDDKSTGPAPTPASDGSSKADFIAAARRAAQAAAQESERVEKQETEKRSFLSRFKGSKKPKQADQPAAKKSPKKGKISGEKGARKERRAIVAEAARKAKKIKEQDATELEEKLSVDASAALVSELLDDDKANKSLFAKLGSAVSRHSRPLLIAAAAILLAITTLQLVQNPNSSLHGLFNKSTIETDGTPQTQGTAPGSTVGPNAGPNVGQPAKTPNQQSSITPSSGNLLPQMQAGDANSTIAFSQPSGAQASLHGPRMTQTAKAPTEPLVDEGVTTFIPQQPKAAPGITPGMSQGIDLTPTSSLPPHPTARFEALKEAAKNQPMPPLPADTSMMASQQGALEPSVQAAIEMNTLLAPGIGDSPLLKAAKAGDGLAQFELGRRLTLGEGMTANLKEAASWFEKAAAQSIPQAQYSLANLYEKGKGVKRDYQVARLWYERAAKAGNVKAMHNLAVLYAEGGLGKPDFSQASRWFILAADHGLRDSQYNLAILYARGMGVKQDLLQSHKWFAIAAQKGDSGAAAKRDEVFNVLSPAQKKTAQAIVKAWVPKVAKPSANKLATIPDEWKNKAPAIVTGAPKPTQATNANGFAITQANIAKAQSMLGALGYNAGPADGQIGPRTRTAIRNFQEVAGLPVTGKIDQALLKALRLRVI